MNRLRLILVAAVLGLCPLVGCEWMKQHGIGKNFGGNGGGQGPLPEVKPESLVSYLNERADRLQSIAAPNVRMVAVDRSGLVPTPPITLRGELFAAQPRNFKLTGAGGTVVDVTMYLGSNDQQFWVYAKVPSVDPMYVYASHSDFEAGKARIPGGIPFEPEWVMQTLGMARFPATNQYKVQPDNRNRTYTLSWPATTPNGVSVVKEVTFDADAATGTRPQVKKHVIRDTKSKIICYAEIKEAKTVQTGATTSSGQPLAVQYPTEVVLRWEEPQKFELRLEMLSAQINQPLTQEELRRHFSRPNVPGATPVDLAHARFDAPLK